MDTSKLPKHVAIILDGNRRWAEKNGIERKNGAWYGVAKAIEIVFSWTIQFEHDYGVKPCDIWSDEIKNDVEIEEDMIAKVYKNFALRIQKTNDNLTKQGR